MIIFDLDQTLVDSSPVEHFRARRAWSAVMRQVPELTVYAGIDDLLAELHGREHTLAILTKSPDMVAKAFVRHNGWPIDIVVGYHDVSRRKPDPEGLVLAMRRGKARPADTVHVGDRPEDTEASRAAGVIAVGSAWGIPDATALEASRPDHLFDTVPDLADFLLSLPP